MSTLLESEEKIMGRPKLSHHFSPPRQIAITKGPDLRSGISIIAGFLPAGILFPDRYVIPYYDPRTKKGYQRQPQDIRINALVNDLRKDRVDLPTAVLLNIRNREALEAVSENKLNLELFALSHASDAATRFFVVDGQHRILALEKLINDQPDIWSHFMIPFVCMIGATEEQEMEQFYVVNSTAKSVRTDLALALLRKRADKDVDVYESLQERGREWQVDGQALVERLAVESPIWKYRIRLPSLEKGETTIPSASMVTSLKPLLASPYFRGLKQEHQMRVLDAYWQGIREILRPAFDDPTSFTIQKGVGVIVLHAVLPHVIELVRSKGWSVMESASYTKILKNALEKLEGDDGDGSPVNGVDFWATAPKGAGGSYSSSAGRRVLAAKIRQHLPEVDVE